MFPQYLKTTYDRNHVLFYDDTYKGFSFTTRNNAADWSIEKFYSGLVDSLYLFEQSQFYQKLTMENYEAYEFRGVPGMVEMAEIVIDYDSFFVEFTAQDVYHQLLLNVVQTFK